LTYSLESNQKWFSLGSRNQTNSWNISKCTFCAFNAFSGTDTRVEARIPGGVKSFVVDVMGGKRGTDSEGWQETFLSSILRTFMRTEEDAEFGSELFMKAKRSLDGLFTLQTEMKFLEIATKLFHKGRLLGSPNGPHLAGNHDNFLTIGVVGYFCSTGRPEISVGFLKHFVEKDHQLKGLMMSCLLKSSKRHFKIKSFTLIPILR
jgi:Chs5-Arf1p-binding protein BUD7/BCH1